MICSLYTVCFMLIIYQWSTYADIRRENYTEKVLELFGICNVLVIVNKKKVKKVVRWEALHQALSHRQYHTTPSWMTSFYGLERHMTHVQILNNNISIINHFCKKGNFFCHSSLSGTLLLISCIIG